MWSFIILGIWEVQLLLLFDASQGSMNPRKEPNTFLILSVSYSPPFSPLLLY